MAQLPNPTLDQLNTSDNPAWLWDGARARVIWANAAGIAMFGGETLFDLIDRPFDNRDPDIKQIIQLIDTMDRKEKRSQSFRFAAASEVELTFNCSCYIHSLPDGRPGLLVVTEDVQEGNNAGNPALMTDILGAMPIAITVADSTGQIVFCNAAAAELIARPNRSTLSLLLGSADDAAAMIERVQAARTVSVLRPLETNFGSREVRVTARLLADEDEAETVLVLLMLEDVTDRRALERTLSDGQHSMTPAANLNVKQTASDDGADEPEAAELEDISQAIADEMAVQDEPEIELPEVPELVSKTLNKRDESIILHRGGKFYFANEAALELLGHKSASAMAVRSDLLERLQQPADSRVQLQIADATGILDDYSVLTGSFPWHDGPLIKSTLDPVTSVPGARADAVTIRSEAAQPDLTMTSSIEVVEEPEAPAAPKAKVEATEVRPEDEPLDETPAVAEPPGDTELPGSTEQIIRLTPEPVPAVVPGDPELRAILDTATDGIVTLDGDGAILSFSAGAEALFGYRLAEVAGTNFVDLLANDSRATLKDYLAALGDGGIASVFNDGREVTGVVSQGGEISLFMTIARLSGQSDAAFCAVLRDITQWKQTETQLRQDKEAAEDSNAQKSEFLAKISHELRTPLNAILGFSDVMRTERFGEIENQQYLGYANDIHKSGSHLLSLINDLLDLSKVEAGKLELNFASVNLRSIVNECFALMQEQATAARVVMRKSLPTDLPDVVADFRSIKQILLNLLSNAIKFTDPGGQIIVSARLLKSGELKFKIKDTGIGMDSAQLQTALEPFKQVETPKRSERLGTGLGLPLTKALIEANRARFDISSEKKKGTLVEITFPTTRVLAD